MSEPLLSVRNLEKHFPVERGVIFNKVVGHVRAVDGVSFDLAEGETLALVGESGCGKSTTARLVLRLLTPTGGSIRFAGEDITTKPARELAAVRRAMQPVFQDPYASLNPRMAVGRIIAEPMEVHGIGDDASRRARVEELLRLVGLAPYHAQRFPHEFSGGQRQRIGIARALAVNPRLVVCDEPVSALDVSIQAQVVNLLKDLQNRLGLSYLFIAHDLAVVRHVSDRIAVMYLGEIVETAPKTRLYAAPLHPYTQALLAAIPVPDPGRRRAQGALAGDVPSPMNPPPGCRFSTRCAHVIARCREERPVLRPLGDDHLVACHRAEDLPVPMIPSLAPHPPSEAVSRRLALAAARRVSP
ncbi:ABC transporter ATP-binding protein [Elioraea sp.]|uniref:ABC transporter ATP-binding protein n=1 Tax=Elioraea sp. TaxID=2185103 RepID=UPI0025BA203C|nr:dipeptide ABC transporter ATP-binding protein [Elioraea sp.]